MINVIIYTVMIHFTTIDYKVLIFAPTQLLLDSSEKSA